MNKSLRLAAFTLLFFTINLSAQFNLEWEQTYGFTGGYENTQGIIVMPDGGVIAGISHTIPFGDTKIRIIRYDNLGNQVWETMLNNTGNNRINDLIDLPDGNIAVSGDNNQPGETSKLWVIKLTTNGTILWEKKIGDKNFYNGNSILSTSDGGFLIPGGRTAKEIGTNNPSGPRSPWLVKLDENGNVEWERLYGGIGVFSQISEAIETPQGDFIIGGSAFNAGGDIPNNNGDYDFWLFKINSIGDIIWAKNYGGIGPEFLKKINLLLDGSMIISGTTNSHGTGDVSAALPANTNFWIIKTDINGTLLWEKSIGGDFFENLGDTEVNASGEIFLVGSTNSSNGDFNPGYGEADIWVFRLDENGNILNKKNYGGSENDRVNTFDLAGDRLAIGGGTNSSDGDITGFSGGLNEDAWTLSLTTNSTPPPGGNIDLELSLSQFGATPQQWDSYRVAAIVTNVSSEDATGVSVSIKAPLGVTYKGGDEFTASQGDFKYYSDEIWTVGQIPAGGRATIDLTYFLLEPNVPTSYAQIITANEIDDDSTPGNGSCCIPNEDDEASTTITCAIDVQIISTDCNDNDTPNDPSDDSFDLSYQASGVNTSATFEAYDPFNNSTPRTNHPFSQNTFIRNFPMDRSRFDLIVKDSENTNCATQIGITPPLLCSSFPFIPCSGNLISNGDFENGTSNWVGDGFRHLTNPYVLINSGQGAVRLASLVDPGTGMPRNYFMEQYFPVASGTTYEVSCYATNNRGKGLAVLNFYKNDGSLISNNQFELDNDTLRFQFIRHSFSQIAPQEAVEAKLTFLAEYSYNGSFEIDDICVIPQLGVPLPDLQITNVQIPSTIVAGENFAAEVTVRNDGPEGFNQSTLIQALVSFGIVSIETTPILNLPPGGSQTFTMPFTMLNFPTAQAETMNFHIDILDTTPELDETNNNFDVDFQLIPPNTGGDIDLELSLAQNDPNPRQWGFYSVTATIENKGGQAANGVTVNFPAQTGVTYKGGDEFTASQGNFKYYSDEIWTVGSIPAGGSATLEVNYFLLVPNAPAAYAQVLSANENDVDSSPGNGTCCTPNEDDEASTNSTTSPTLPDLFLEDLKILNSVKAGEILDYTFDLRNGNANPISGDFTILSFISTNQILGVGDIPEGTIVTGNIGGNANIQDVNGQSTIPTNLAPGNYFLIVNIDAFQDIPETNDLNNLIIAPFTVTGGNTGENHDLNLSLTADDGRQWSNFSATYVISNLSSAPTTGIKAEIKKPDGVVYTGGNEYNTAQGTFDLFGSEVWDVGTIQPSDQAVLTLNYFRVSADPIELYGQITASDQSDPDSTPGNGTCCTAVEDDEASRTLGSNLNRAVNNRSAVFEADKNQNTFLQSVFPNPTMEQVTLRMIAKEASETEIQIVDNFGRILRSESWNLDEGVNLKTIDISDFPSGIYQILGQPFHPYLRQARFMKVE